MANTITSTHKITHTRNNYPQTFEVHVYNCEDAATAEDIFYTMMTKRGIDIRDILSTTKV